MSDISPQMVKELRERTGVGMGKCKEALQEAHGDMELAIANLRKAGMASAIKKEGRETNEGVISHAENAHGLVLVELNAETDFVVKNEKFQAFATTVAHVALSHKVTDVPSLLKALSGEHSIEELRVGLIQTLGENIQVRRMTFLPKESNHSYAIYSHAGGKLATVVVLVGAENQERLARDIAMHIAAESPEYLSSEEVPSSIIENEKEIARAQIQNKPAQIVDKIVTGKLEAYFNQACLLNQKFIKDPAISIAELVAKVGKEIQKPLKITRFLRWKIGG